MSLPRAVLEAEEAANKLYEEAYNPNEPEATEGNPQTPAPDPEPESSAAQGIAPQPVGSQQTETASTADDGSWEHRYKVLSGKYNAEVPVLAADNRELKNRLKTLETELEAMKTATPQEPLLKPEEIAEYGESFIDVVRRAAREELAAKEAEISQLRSKIDSIEATTIKSVEVSFYEDLTRLVPEWNVINDDTNFHKWLDTRDDLTGMRRQDMLALAEQDKDARRVANFFIAFQKANQSWAASANNALASQVVPDSHRTTEVPPSKRIWSRGDIQSFYAQVRRGEVSEKDALAIEADIMAAQVEGRVK